MDAASWKKDEDDIMFGRLYCLKICNDIKLLFCLTTLTMCHETELKFNNALLDLIDVTLEMLSHFLVIISCTV